METFKEIFKSSPSPFNFQANSGFHLCEGIQADQQLVMTCFSFLFSRKKATFSDEQTTESDEEVSGIQNTKLFIYKELKMATGNFHYSNKIGESFRCCLQGNFERWSHGCYKGCCQLTQSKGCESS